MGWGAAAPCWAGRPFATEDAGALARGDCEWEAVAARAATAGDATRRGGSGQLGCGIGAGTQLALSGGIDRGGGKHERATAFSGKTSVAASEDGGGWTLAWGMAVRRTDQGERLGTHALTLVRTQPLLERLTAHANLGWQRDRARASSSTLWNLALEWGWREGWDVGAEWYGDDRSRPWLGGGLRWSNDAFAVFGALARRPGGPREHLTTLGVKLAF